MFIIIIIIIIIIIKLCYRARVTVHLKADSARLR